MNVPWKALAPAVVAIVIAAIPAPAGLPQHTWYYFAIFAGVVVGLMLEPIPGAAIGLIAVTLVTVLAEWVSLAATGIVAMVMGVCDAVVGGGTIRRAAADSSREPPTAPA